MITGTIPEKKVRKILDTTITSEASQFMGVLNYSY